MGLCGSGGEKGLKDKQKFQVAAPVGTESKQEQWQEPQGRFWEDDTGICKLFGFS